MKVISTGVIYDLYDDTLQTHDTLPPQTYVVRFSNTRGFYLEKYVELELKESKIYGVHPAKVEKVLASFGEFNRSLGVILSGDKGIGKSLFARLLGMEAIKRDIPVIVVDRAIPGIESFIETIEQEVMVLFDEFDKTFGEVKAEDGKASPQAHLLSLFDGVSGGKKLYVITCNNMWKLNEYLINRPGRFHYHFRFEYPSPQEIREYLEDKLPEDRWGEIAPVIAFSRKIELNYDCLRAIAFEIARGESFKSAIADLNILDTERTYFRVELRYSNGEVYRDTSVRLDLFDDEDECAWLDGSGGDQVCVTFHPKAVRVNPQTNTMFVPVGEFTVSFDEEHPEVKNRLLGMGIESLTIVRPMGKGIHYAL